MNPFLGFLAVGHHLAGMVAGSRTGKVVVSPSAAVDMIAFPSSDVDADRTARNVTVKSRLRNFLGHFFCMLYEVVGGGEAEASCRSCEEHTSSVRSSCLAQVDRIDSIWLLSFSR